VHTSQGRTGYHDKCCLLTRAGLAEFVSSFSEYPTRLPEEWRDRDNPIQYVMTASREFEQKLADFIQAQGQWTPPA